MKYIKQANPINCNEVVAKLVAPTKLVRHTASRTKDKDPDNLPPAKRTKAAEPNSKFTKHFYSYFLGKEYYSTSKKERYHGLQNQYCTNV